MKKFSYEGHTAHQFDVELNDIKHKVMNMGGLVESMVHNGLEALMTMSAEIGSQVSADDDRVNRLELEIDEECTRILARRQPAASDLRMVLTIIKTISDLERIGDEAEKLGRISVKLSNETDVPRYYKDLRHLGDLVKSMLSDALDAFTRMDVESAFRTAAKDEVIDREYGNFARLMITHMMEDPSHVSHALDMSWCARSLERIADHACNICEYVVYLVEGQDIRHANLDDMRKKLL
jgi:phosphate transport system protein